MATLAECRIKTLGNTRRYTCALIALTGLAWVTLATSVMALDPDDPADSRCHLAARVEPAPFFQGWPFAASCDLVPLAEPALVPKVVRGAKAEEGEFPAVVALRYAGDDDAICSGTLVSSKVLVTAKHCVCDSSLGPPTEVRVGLSAFAGIHYKVYASLPIGGACSAGLDGSSSVDIGLVFLEDSVTDIRPVSLASEDAIKGAGSFVVAGYGVATTKQDEVYADGTKSYGEIGIASRRCDHVLDDIPDSLRFGCIAGLEIVADAKSPKFMSDSCNGDSGGPLLLKASPDALPTTPGYMLVGVTSRSITNPGILTGGWPCGKGGIYGRLLPSIRRIIADAVASHP